MGVHVTENRSVGGSIPPLGTTLAFASVHRRPPATFLKIISKTCIHSRAHASAPVRWHPLAPLVHLLAPNLSLFFGASTRTPC
jgi:hypothetical protein